MTEQIKRGRGRPRKPETVSPKTAQLRFIASMKAKGYERFQTWAPIEFKPLVAEMNRRLASAPNTGLKDKLRHHFIIATMEALDRQRSIMTGAQWLRDNGYSETIIDKYIDDCVHCYEFSADMNRIRCAPDKFIHRQSDETMT